MGGHTQYGEFANLKQALIAWNDTIEQYEGLRMLWLVHGEIKRTKTSQNLYKYVLVMRFSK